MDYSERLKKIRAKFSSIDNELQVVLSEMELSASVEADKSGSNKTVQDKINYIAAYIALGPKIADDVLLHMLLRSAMYTVKASGAGLTLFDQEKQRLVFKAAIGDGAEGVIGYEIPLADSQHGLAFATGEVQSSTPLHTDIELESKTIFRNVLVAPLIVEDEPIGTISAVNRQEGDHFTPFDMQAYKLFADLAALVIQQRLREQAMKQYIEGGKSALSDELGQLPGTGSVLEVMALVKDIMALTVQQENALPIIREYVSLLLQGGKSTLGK